MYADITTVPAKIGPRRRGCLEGQVGRERRSSKHQNSGCQQQPFHRLAPQRSVAKTYGSTQRREVIFLQQSPGIDCTIHYEISRRVIARFQRYKMPSRMNAFTADVFNAPFPPSARPSPKTTPA